MNKVIWFKVDLGPRISGLIYLDASLKAKLLGLPLKVLLIHLQS